MADDPYEFATPKDGNGSITGAMTSEWALMHVMNRVKDRTQIPSGIKDYNEIVQNYVYAGKSKTPFNKASGVYADSKYDALRPGEALNNATKNLGATWAMVQQDPAKHDVMTIDALGGRYAYCACRDAQQQEQMAMLMKQNQIGCLEGKKDGNLAIIIPGDELVALDKNMVGGLKSSCDRLPAASLPSMKEPVMAPSLTPNSPMQNR